MSDTEKVAAEVWDAVRHLKAIAAGVLPVGRECRVLVVDDSPDDVYALCRKLAKFRVNCRFCASAKEASELMDANHFDVVMVDLVMPVMDGAEFIEHEMTKAKGTSFVAITGHPKDAPIVSKVLRLGGVVSFQKPVTVEQLQGIFPPR